MGTKRYEHPADKWYNNIWRQHPTVFEAIENAKSTCGEVDFLAAKRGMPGSPHEVTRAWSDLSTIRLAVDRGDWFTAEGLNLAFLAFGRDSSLMMADKLRAMSLIQSLSADASTMRLVPSPSEFAVFDRWQDTRQVVRIDPDFAEELASSDGMLEIPCGLFDRLPYSTFFVEAPRELIVCIPKLCCLDDDKSQMSELIQAHNYTDDPHAGPDYRKALAAGFFVTRFSLPVGKTATTWSELETGDQIAIVWVDSHGRFLDESVFSLGLADVNAMLQEERDAGLSNDAIRQAMGFGERVYDRDLDYVASDRAAAEFALAILSYLCSVEPDIIEGEPTGYRTKIKRRDEREIGGTPTCVVGSRFGAAIRKGKNSSRASGGSVRPHVRRGHFHHYWTGPMDGERVLVLKWVAPTFVNAGKGPLATTIHDVEAPGGAK